MSAPRWRPIDEATATGTLAAFIEWLRATHRLARADPASVHNWRRSDPRAFAAAMLAFAGIDPALGFRGNLARHTGPREALVVRTISGRRAWSRNALGDAADLPAPIAAALAAGTAADLPVLAFSHLLLADTRPDDRLLWRGDAWLLGAWLVGATIVVADDSDHARAEGAVNVTAPDNWRD